MMRKPTMKLLMSGALVAVILLSAVRRADPVLARASSQTAAVRETVRVGVWTLRRDQQVNLTPIEFHGSRLRQCAKCTAMKLNQLTEVRAAGNALTLTSPGKADRANNIWIDGGVTLVAHGEKLTVIYPVSIAARDGVLVMVATLPVESYVERVVASESGAEDSLESLKALAIVVRTFALHEAHGHADYDLCDSTHCQLLRWGGGDRGRTAAAHKVTLSTAGETLWYKGQRALGYFEKDCGGRTASPAEIWPKAPQVPYLTSQPDRFCSSGGVREWASEITRAELTLALAARGLVRPGWQNLSMGSRGVSGRALTIRLDGQEIPAEDFRLAVGESLGWNRMPSTWFELSRQGEQYLFHGRGWGNGVGLCQKGATVMAGQGMGARQILDTYFPGASAADEESGRIWLRFSGNGFELESLDPSDAHLLPEISRARAEASERSGLNGGRPFTIRAFAGTTEFRSATLAPGWVAAFTEGGWIATQPLRTLAGRHLLADTMRHEFLHALVESNAGPTAPLWLREGLVETWSSGDGTRVTRADEQWALSDVDAKLAHAASEAESEAAHRIAGQCASRLLAQYGCTTVLQWLRSGVPTGVTAQI
jgi:stage II sporulation protein D